VGGLSQVCARRAQHRLKLTRRSQLTEKSLYGGSSFDSMVRL
jgi:hypothetical protein